mmetsp:Transcript_2586/g.4854  ORF Transcript_2586/g.4854 Transcript_2586/m.4854 type:complete len:166 (+) Transcript_2586:375-872(+)
MSYHSYGTTSTHSTTTPSTASLCRNTCEDNWFDNFINTALGHVYGQILVPLDGSAHSIQQWLPFAQMPLIVMVGIKRDLRVPTIHFQVQEDRNCIFGTRNGGRLSASNSAATTREDMIATKQNPLFHSIWPFVGLTLLAEMKLHEWHSHHYSKLIIPVFITYLIV